MNRIVSISAIACALACATARADVVELRNGNVLNGTYRSGTATAISFEAFGNVLQLATKDIVSLTFTAPPPAPAPAPAVAAGTPAATPAPSATGAVTVPAGTLLLVRMLDSVSSQNAPGASFSTKLEYDLIVNGVIVAKAGTKVYGKVQSATQARRAMGRSTLDLRLVQIAPNGAPVPISTSSHAGASEASVAKVAKAAAVGAVIGNNTGDGDQGTGAAIGAGAAMLKPGQTLTVPPGTLLEFSLTQPATIPAAP